MIDIHRGDSYQYMREMRNDSVGVVLADPLYNLDEATRNKFHSEFTRICRGTIIVFCPPENLWQPRCDETLFWIKPISTKNTSRHYSRFVEVMQVFRFEKSIWNTGRNWSQYTNVFTDLVDDNLHDKGWRKPPSLIRRLLLNHANKDTVVFDPFMGSGVIGEVCAALKFPYIGVEEKEQEFLETQYRLQLMME